MSHLHGRRGGLVAAPVEVSLQLTRRGPQA
jgi:hypothetical protein